MLEYCGQFLGNSGNYKGFGDSKFIPRIPAEAFELLASITPETSELYQKAQAGGGIYGTDDQKKMHLGYPENGHVSSYYPDSPHISKEEISAIGDFCEGEKLLLENTRLRKTSSGDFEVLIASGIANPPEADRDVAKSEWELDGKLKGKKLRLVYGDHREEMAKIALNIKKAGNEAANATQKKMHDEYAKSFGTGSIEAYKESQRDWIKDKGPVVESDLGFVETYRDPHGVRGEWEGFVAMVSRLHFSFGLLFLFL